MPTLHISHQGGRLRLRAGRLILTDAEGNAVSSIPARKVRRVVVHGNVGFTTPALTFLLKNRGSIHFISVSGDYYGQASATPLPDPWRIKQQLSLAAEKRLQIGKAILKAKVRSQAEYLRRSGADASVSWLPDWSERLCAARNLDELRGLEGLASRSYFSAIARHLQGHGFYGRRRRPPPDPVNAALSYGYAILLSLVTSALLAAEIHPEIGILHATGRRRPALALDLMEEFRVPVVDAPVFRSFRRGWLSKSDVRHTNNGVLLTTEGKKKLIKTLESRLEFMPAGSKESYGQLMFTQAERLASAIVHGKEYSGYALSRG